ncbi:MAG: hypothetical protein AB7S38_11480 [Vulcanimicrobiota bacterium]
MLPTVREATEHQLTDLAGANRHILGVVESQQNLEELRLNPAALALLGEIEATLQGHDVRLRTVAALKDRDFESGIKRALSALSGAVVGSYNHLRRQAVSRALRDTYAGLAFMSAGYVNLKTYGLTLGDLEISKMAYDHFVDLTKLLVRLSQEMVVQTHREIVATRNTPFQQEIVDRVIAATQRAWRDA